MRSSVSSAARSACVQRGVPGFVGRGVVRGCHDTKPSGDGRGLKTGPRGAFEPPVSREPRAAVRYARRGPHPDAWPSPGGRRDGSQSPAEADGRRVDGAQSRRAGGGHLAAGGRAVPPLWPAGRRRAFSTPDAAPARSPRGWRSSSRARASSASTSSTRTSTSRARATRALAPRLTFEHRSIFELGAARRHVRSHRLPPRAAVDPARGPGARRADAGHAPRRAVCT